MRPLPSSCLILLVTLACRPGKVQGPDQDTVGTDDPLECEDELVAAVEWFEDDTTGSWSGSLEFGQTHVTSVPETRHAPPVIAERESLLLFTPDDAIDETADVRVTAWEGQTQLGTLPAQAPTELPGILEQDLTDVELDPYSTQAWSVTLPWDWLREGVVLWIGTTTDDGVRVHEHELEGLGAPQRFTMTRSKIVLFGDESIDTSTHTAEQITRDYFGSLPVAELRWVDTTDWLVDEVVVETEDGYRMVSSEEERTSLTTDTSRWAILKHQFALRMSAANTGRGLVLNEGWEGDSSPYSFGTSVVMGWVVDEEGTASDIDDAGVAAGWTGWTAMWVDECGNTFIHEIGHS
ncbi:MAG: M66 family metalloprotease, partial [Myxococcota bacterium]|nr:M66 family metalloprotease [Myxococcota bacterium]